MNGERIVAVIIMVLCDVLCGGCFVGMGIWAMKRKDPMHFYSGTTVDPRTVSDIRAYNRENGRMWLIYSVPFWVSAIAAFFHLGISAIIMGVSCVPGFLWLIFRYKRICAKYMIS